MRISLVATLSLYREGELAHTALQSLADAQLDAIFVCEGAAGMEAPGAPKTDIRLGLLPDNLQRIVHQLPHSNWKSDGEKRTSILRWVQETFPSGPLWGIHLDGDETLQNGWALRDHLQHLQDVDEQVPAAHQVPAAQPTVGWPLRHVEPDGSVTVCKERCLRLDLLESYELSNLILRWRSGATSRPGHHPESLSKWINPRVKAYQPRDQMWLMPPLPGEPFTVHRPHLRHPRRAAIRMHHQESELLKGVDGET